MATPRQVINDAGDGIELNGVPDGPDGGLGGKAVALSVPVLVDAKSELDEEQVPRKVFAVTAAAAAAVCSVVAAAVVLDEFGTEAEAFPFLAPGRSFKIFGCLAGICASPGGNQVGPGCPR